MNQTIHFMGIPTFSLKIVIFNQKLLMDITKPKGKSLWLNSPKKRKIPSWQVENKPFQLAAIICGKWEFWQIYAQWRLIVGDKCWFLQPTISDHPMPPLLWTTAKCTTSVPSATFLQCACAPRCAWQCACAPQCAWQSGTPWCSETAPPTGGPSTRQAFQVLTPIYYPARPFDIL